MQLLASLAAYVMASGAVRWGRRPFPASRHVGVWLGAVGSARGRNAFWWWPGVWLASTKGPSDFAFVPSRAGPAPTGPDCHDRGDGREPAHRAGVLGLAVMLRDARPGSRRAHSGGFAVAPFGFAWGYLAGASRTLDFLQPGRHTFAFYFAAALAAGVLCWSKFWAGLGAGGRWLPVAAHPGMALLGLRHRATQLVGVERLPAGWPRAVLLFEPPRRS